MSVTLETLLIDGQPKPEQARWVHGCGQRGNWLARALARRGGSQHAGRCKSSPIVPGFHYEIHLVGELSVVLQHGERLGRNYTGNWLLRGRGTIEGLDDLLQQVQDAGGLIVWDWTSTVPSGRASNPVVQVFDARRCQEPKVGGRPCGNWVNHRRRDGALVCGIHVGDGAFKLTEADFRAIQAGSSS